MTLTSPAALRTAASLIIAVTGLACTTAAVSAQGASGAACDRLAASPHDASAAAEPVPWFALQQNATEAINACRGAIIEDSTNPRFRYQMARALDAAGRYEEAVAIFESLTAQPYPAALADLASLYMSGSGVKQDWEKSFALASQAAEAGDLRGITVMGVHLVIAPDRTDEDKKKGFGLVLDAANKGYGEAMEVLGDFQAPGGAWETNEVAAYEWYQKAAEKGRTRSAFNAGLFAYKTPATHDRAYALFLQAAQAGYVPAMIYTANMLLRGDGTEKNAEEGLAWLKRSAEAGDRAAFYALGRVYETGSDLQQDLAQAKIWYERGVEQGDPAAAYRLARGYSKGHYGNKPALIIDYLVYAALAGHEQALRALLSGLPQDRWSVDSRKALQERLAAEGLYNGQINGVIEPATIEAVKAMLLN